MSMSHTQALSSDAQIQMEVSFNEVEAALSSFAEVRTKTVATVLEHSGDTSEEDSVRINSLHAARSARRSEAAGFRSVTAAGAPADAAAGAPYSGSGTAWTISEIDDMLKSLKEGVQLPEDGAKILKSSSSSKNSNSYSSTSEHKYFSPEDFVSHEIPEEHSCHDEQDHEQPASSSTIFQEGDAGTGGAGHPAPGPEGQVETGVNLEEVEEVEQDQDDVRLKMSTHGGPTPVNSFNHERAKAEWSRFKFTVRAAVSDSHQSNEIVVKRYAGAGARGAGSAAATSEDTGRKQQQTQPKMAAAIMSSTKGRKSDSCARGGGSGISHSARGPSPYSVPSGGLGVGPSSHQPATARGAMYPLSARGPTNYTKAKQGSLSSSRAASNTNANRPPFGKLNSARAANPTSAAETTGAAGARRTSTSAPSAAQRASSHNGSRSRASSTNPRRRTIHAHSSSHGWADDPQGGPPARTNSADNSNDIKSKRRSASCTSAKSASSQLKNEVDHVDQPRQNADDETDQAKNADARPTTRRTTTSSLRPPAKRARLDTSAGPPASKVRDEQLHDRRSSTRHSSKPLRSAREYLKGLSALSSPEKVPPGFDHQLQNLDRRSSKASSKMDATAAQAAEGTTTSPLLRSEDPDSEARTKARTRNYGEENKIVVDPVDAVADVEDEDGDEDEEQYADRVGAPDLPRFVLEEGVHNTPGDHDEQRGNKNDEILQAAVVRPQSLAKRMRDRESGLSRQEESPNRSRSPSSWSEQVDDWMAFGAAAAEEPVDPTGKRCQSAKGGQNVVAPKVATPADGGGGGTRSGWDEKQALGSAEDEPIDIDDSRSSRSASSSSAAATDFDHFIADYVSAERERKLSAPSSVGGVVTKAQPLPFPPPPPPPLKSPAVVGAPPSSSTSIAAGAGCAPTFIPLKPPVVHIMPASKGKGRFQDYNPSVQELERQYTRQRVMRLPSPNCNIVGLPSNTTHFNNGNVAAALLQRDQKSGPTTTNMNKRGAGGSKPNKSRSSNYAAGYVHVHTDAGVATGKRLPSRSQAGSSPPASLGKRKDSYESALTFGGGGGGNAFSPADDIGGEALLSWSPPGRGRSERARQQLQQPHAPASATGTTGGARQQHPPEAMERVASKLQELSAHLDQVTRQELELREKVERVSQAQFELAQTRDKVRKEAQHELASKVHEMEKNHEELEKKVTGYESELGLFKAAVSGATPAELSSADEGASNVKNVMGPGSGYASGTSADTTVPVAAAGAGVSSSSALVLSPTANAQARSDAFAIATAVAEKRDARLASLVETMTQSRFSALESTLLNRIQGIEQDLQQKGRSRAGSAPVSPDDEDGVLRLSSLLGPGALLKGPDNNFGAAPTAGESPSAIPSSDPVREERAERRRKLLAGQLAPVLLSESRSLLKSEIDEQVAKHLFGGPTSSGRRSPPAPLSPRGRAHQQHSPPRERGAAAARTSATPLGHESASRATLRDFVRDQLLEYQEESGLEGERKAVSRALDALRERLDTFETVQTAHATSAREEAELQQREAGGLKTAILQLSDRMDAALGSVAAQIESDVSASVGALEKRTVAKVTEQVGQRTELLLGEAVEEAVDAAVARTKKALLTDADNLKQFREEMKLSIAERCDRTEKALAARVEGALALKVDEKQLERRMHAMTKELLGTSSPTGGGAAGGRGASRGGLFLKEEAAADLVAAEVGRRLGLMQEGLEERVAEKMREHVETMLLERRLVVPAAAGATSSRSISPAGARSATLPIKKTKAVLAQGAEQENENGNAPRSPSLSPRTELLALQERLAKLQTKVFKDNYAQAYRSGRTSTRGGPGRPGGSFQAAGAEEEDSDVVGEEDQDRDEGAADSYENELQRREKQLTIDDLILQMEDGLPDGVSTSTSTHTDLRRKENVVGQRNADLLLVDDLEQLFSHTRAPRTPTATGADTAAPGDQELLRGGEAEQEFHLEERGLSPQVRAALEVERRTAKAIDSLQRSTNSPMLLALLSGDRSRSSPSRGTKGQGGPHVHDKTKPGFGGAATSPSRNRTSTEGNVGKEDSFLNLTLESAARVPTSQLQSRLASAGREDDDRLVVDERKRRKNLGSATSSSCFSDDVGNHDSEKIFFAPAARPRKAMKEKDDEDREQFQTAVKETSANATELREELDLLKSQLSAWRTQQMRDIVKSSPPSKSVFRTPESATTMGRRRAANEHGASSTSSAGEQVSKRRTKRTKKASLPSTSGTKRKAKAADKHDIYQQKQSKKGVAADEGAVGKETEARARGRLHRALRMLDSEESDKPTRLFRKSGLV
eukprot:CAMPEP_0178987976 /NCGR_PEP_ID=MMETSP0795-20121207/3564_1 /TAXON_ID=88552 /ORGANISM="Amoebophrya sp., Strain Ameob2" /LENGTH=2295 /DNA_ID=CAMNT_0020679219 /DNA_START=151 /DNA_END=7039 /DNA_ORIENTATION=+